jgi:hypothetical protein
MFSAGKTEARDHLCRNLSSCETSKAAMPHIQCPCSQRTTCLILSGHLSLPTHTQYVLLSLNVHYHYQHTLWSTAQGAHALKP